MVWRVNCPPSPRKHAGRDLFARCANNPDQRSTLAASNDTICGFYRAGRVRGSVNPCSQNTLLHFAITGSNAHRHDVDATMSGTGSGLTLPGTGKGLALPGVPGLPGKPGALQLGSRSHGSSRERSGWRR
jgi:hypothetical protein